MMRRFLTWLAQALIGFALIVAFAFMLVEWASGCGESYVDAKGKTHINECVFISKP